VFVPGEPKPGGSKRALLARGSKRPVVVDDCKKTKDWQTNVRHFAYQAYEGPLQEGALRLTVTFYLVRARSHYGTGRNRNRLKPSAPPDPNRRPDTTKLLRSTEDALTGLVWRDDAQIIEHYTFKRWGPKPGAQIMVETIGARQNEEDAMTMEVGCIRCGTPMPVPGCCMPCYRLLQADVHCYRYSAAVAPPIVCARNGCGNHMTTVGYCTECYATLAVSLEQHLTAWQDLRSGVENCPDWTPDRIADVMGIVTDCLPREIEEELLRRDEEAT